MRNLGWLVVYYQLGGAIVFALGTVLLGVALRRRQEKAFAQRTSRISHLLYWLCLVMPGLLGILVPGLTHFDRLIGIPPLPYRGVSIAVGLVLFVPGLYLSGASNAALNKLGHGAAAFKLTKSVVQSAVYERTRNPMSLGYYLAIAGISLLAGSTYLTCVALLLVVPAHAFNLKYFEELELELRYGQSYLEYKQRVPFLIPTFGPTPKSPSANQENVIRGAD